MFEPKRTFLFLNQREHSLFMSKRLTFDDSVEEGKKEQKVETPDKKTLSVDEKAAVLYEISTKLSFSEWKTNEPSTKNFERMAAKLYPKDAVRREYATFELNDAFGPASDTEGRAEREKLLKENKCKSVRIKADEMKFFDGNGKEIELAQTHVRLRPEGSEGPTPEQAAELKAKKEAEDAEKAEKERVAKETEEKNKALVTKFQEWFPGKNIKVNGGLAPAPYILNLDPGHADNVYDETEGKTTFGRAFGQVKNPVVAINDGTIVEVEGVKYVKTDQALLKRSVTEKGVVQKKNIWVKVIDLQKAELNGEGKPTGKASKETIETVNQWGNPDKGNNTLESDGEIDNTGDHTTKKDAEFISYEGHHQTGIAKGESVYVIDGKTYTIDKTKYVRAVYGPKHSQHEGWIKVEDIYTTEKAKVVETKEEKAEKTKEAKAKELRNKYGETNDKGETTLHFETAEDEHKTTLKDIFVNAQEGDTVEITAPGKKPRTATFLHGDFVYPNNEHAIILNDYKIGKYTKAARLTGVEKAPETVDSIGFFDLKNPEDRPGLRTYLEMAETLLEGDKAKRKELGINVDEALLNDLKESNIAKGVNKYAFAEMLKEHQVGNRIFIPLVIKGQAEKMAKMDADAGNIRAMEAGKTLQKSQAIIDKYSANDYEALAKKETFNVGENLRELAKDKDKWNAVWDSEEGQRILGKDRLIQIWENIPPYDKKESQLRDTIREIILHNYNSRFRMDGDQGLMFTSLIKVSQIYKKKDGSAGTASELFSEFKEATAEYNAIPKNVREFYEGGSVETMLARVAEKMRLNRERYGQDASSKQVFEGLSETEQRVGTLIISDNYLKIQRYQYVSNVFKGSMLLMDGMSQMKLEDVKETETTKERPLNDAETRLHEIFGKDDTGGKTQSDIGGDSREAHLHDGWFSYDMEQGPEGETTETRILPWLKGVPVLSILAINWSKGEPEFLNKYTSGETAWVRTLNKCKDANGKVDEAKVVEELNKLIRIGIWGLSKNPDVKPEELYKKLNIDPNAEDREKQLYNQLKLNSPNDLKNTINKYQKLVIQIGYVVDASATEGKVESPKEVNGQKVTVDNIDDLSTNPAIRGVQLAALKAGYPANEIKDIPQKIKSNMVAGAFIDLGGDGRGAGAGGAIPIPIGHDLYIGVGGGYFGHAGQGLLSLGTQKEVAENLSAAGGLGASVPLSGPHAGEITPGLAGGLEFTFPIDDSTWDGFLDIGASANLRKLVTGGNPLGIGVAAGFKWNPDKSMDKATKAKLEEYKLDKIDKALDDGNTTEAINLIRNHPSLGKFVTYMEMNYDWGKEDILKFYGEQKQALRNAAVEDVDPILTRIGVAAGVEVGMKEPGVELGVILAISVGKTVTLYRTESRGTTAMKNGGDKAIDAQLFEKAQKMFPGAEVKFSKLQKLPEEKASIIYGPDGKPVINAIGKEEYKIDVNERHGGKTLEDYNKGLKDAGIQLRQSKESGEEGLLEVAIPELAQKDDPTYNKVSTRVYIDPAIAGNKGLILRNGKIFLATGANPDLIFRRVDYYTPFRDHDGAGAHSIITISDLPGRTVGDIQKASGKYLYKRPGQPLQIRESDNGVEQTSVMKFEDYSAKDKASIEFYEERDWSKETEAVKAREATFEKIGDEPIREGLVPANEKDMKSNVFSKRFYDKFHTEYKKLTTGDTADMTKLFGMIDAEWEKDKANDPKAPLTIAEKNKIFLDLTRRSWSSIEGLSPAERQRKFHERLDWAKEILLPIWDKKIKEINAAKPGTINESAESLLDYVILKLRDTNLQAEPDKLPEGNIMTTLAGTEGITGMRPNNGAMALLGLDHYEQFLGHKSREGEIARVILETLSPLPEEDAELMQSPLGLTVLSKRGLIFANGVENFNRLTECYKALRTKGKDGLAKALKDEGNRKAFDEFKDLVKKIRAAQTTPGVNVVKLGNNCYLKLKPLQVGAGVDKSCANFSIMSLEDFDVMATSPEQPVVLGARAAEHSTVEAYKVPAFFQFGIGAMGTIKPKPKPPKPIPPGGGDTPPSETPPKDKQKPEAGSTVKETAGEEDGAGKGQGGNVGGTEGTKGGPKDSEGTPSGGVTVPRANAVPRPTMTATEAAKGIKAVPKFPPKK